MQDTTSMATIVGLALPIAVAVVQRAHWSKRTRTLVAVGIALAAGVGTAYAAGDLNPQSVTASVAAVLVASTAAYKGFYKQLGIQWVEESTSPIGPRNDPYYDDSGEVDEA